MDSPVFVPRRSSYHKKQCSLGDENLFASSPVVPTYMAATKSAKAKTRSLSSPKVRAGNFDTCSESYSPCKKNISLISSVVSEMPISSTTARKMGKSSGLQQRSPSLRGLSSPIKSRQTPKDRSFDSECSISYWDRQSTCRWWFQFALEKDNLVSVFGLDCRSDLCKLQVKPSMSIASSRITWREISSNDQFTNLSRWNNHLWSICYQCLVDTSSMFDWYVVNIWFWLV